MTQPQSILDEPWLYRWAAALFLSPPDVEGLALYRSPEGRALLDKIALQEGMREPVECLKEAATVAVDLNRSAARFAGAHSRAFLTGAQRSAPPYASFWLSKRGLLFQGPTRTMNKLMAELGLQTSPDVRESGDHLSIQLNVLADLVGLERTGETPPIRAEAFAREHLMTWLPAFANACGALRDRYFYSDLACGLSTLLAARLSICRQRETQDTSTKVEAQLT